MYPGEFETLFRNVADLFTLESISKKKKLEGNFPRRSGSSFIWDTLDSLEDCKYVDIGNEKYVSCESFLRKPVRILFFILYTEFESRLFRIHEWNGKEVSKLNEQNIKELVEELLESELTKLQSEYSSKEEFKKDLESILEFKSTIIHTNKKLQKEVHVKTVIEKKNQINRILLALQQILDNKINN